MRFKVSPWTLMILRQGEFLEQGWVSWVLLLPWVGQLCRCPSCWAVPDSVSLPGLEHSSGVFFLFFSWLAELPCSFLSQLDAPGWSWSPAPV